jgi:hypothetical protein
MLDRCSVSDGKGVVIGLPANTRRSLTAALKRERRSLDRLLDGSTELILFGSRAADLAGATSDWDLLWIGTHSVRVNTRTLDIIPLTPSRCDSPLWLETELAGHVATHGIWIKGLGHWRTQTRITERTLIAKSRRVAQHVELLERWGNDLTQDVLTRNYVRLRRDLQRYFLLLQSIAVPTTAELETMWRTSVQDDDLHRISLLARALPQALYHRVMRQLELHYLRATKH